MVIKFDITEYRIAAFKSSQAGDNFFNKYNFVSLLQSGNYSELIRQTIEFLKELKGTDQKAYFSIHKGTPFYWMGVAALLSNDYVSATHFLDAALSEDFRTKESSDVLKSPALFFALLDDSFPNQAARNIVSVLKQRILNVVRNYNLHMQKSQYLSFDTIRDKLFRETLSYPNHPWRNLHTSFIAFFGEYYYQKSIIELRDIKGSSSFYFSHLFRGCLIFESLLKENKKHILKPEINTLNKALKELKNNLQISNENTRIGNTTLPKVLDEVDSCQLTVQKCIELTGKLRNTIGHNLVWGKGLNETQYEKLFMAVAFSCLHAINLLYAD